MIDLLTASSGFIGQAEKLLEGQLVEELGRPLTREERDDLRDGLARSLSGCGTSLHPRILLNMRGGVARAIMVYRTQSGISRYNCLNAFTDPGFRCQGLQRQLFTWVRSETGLRAAKVLVPPLDWTYRSLHRVGFVIHPFRCMERTLSPVEILVKLETTNWGYVYRFGRKSEFDVALGRVDQEAAITALQQQLAMLVPFAAPPEGVRHEVAAMLACPNLFQGQLWSLRCNGEVVGAAKLFAVFCETSNRWVLYLRNVIITRKWRGLGVFGYFIDGILTLALSCFNRSLLSPQASMIVRSFVPDDDKVTNAFQNLGFIPCSYRLAEYPRRKGLDRRLLRRSAALT